MPSPKSQEEYFTRHYIFDFHSSLFVKSRFLWLLLDLSHTLFVIFVGFWDLSAEVRKNAWRSHGNVYRSRRIPFAQYAFGPLGLLMRGLSLISWRWFWKISGNWVRPEWLFFLPMRSVWMFPYFSLHILCPLSAEETRPMEGYFFISQHKKNICRTYCYQYLLTLFARLIATIATQHSCSYFCNWGKPLFAQDISNPYWKCKQLFV